MAITQNPIYPDELMAYVDGVLDHDRAYLIEQRAQYDLELAATIADFRLQQQVLRASLAPVLDEAIPARLLHIPGPSRASFHRIAAAIVWLTLGAVLGSATSWQYLSRDGGATANLARRNPADELPRFVHQAVVAYGVFAPEVRHPVELGSTDAQALNTWLSQRLQRHMQAPDLSELGLALIGGRLLPAEINKPAAQFMYEDREGQRITMYLRGMAEPTAETAFRFAQQGRVSTFYWVEGNWGYALSGELSRTQLLRIAHLIHSRLSLQLSGTTPIIPL